MNRELAKHLMKSGEVRSALKKEALQLVIYVTVSISAVACLRYFTNRPMADGLWSVSVGMLGIIFMWLLSAIRTLRAVLREHGYLER